MRKHLDRRGTEELDLMVLIANELIYDVSAWLAMALTDAERTLIRSQSDLIIGVARLCRF